MRYFGVDVASTICYLACVTKIHTSLLAIFATISFVSLAADMRTVNNISINLDPIHVWESTNGPSSARPMPHWKYIRIDAVTKTISGTMHEVTIIVDGSSRSVILKNMPRDLSRDIARLDQLRNISKRGESWTASAKARASAAEARVPSYVAASGSADYVNAVMADTERRQAIASQARAEAEHSQAQLDAIQREEAALAEKLSSIMILAMSNGAVYNRLPVWDTGLR